jgi:hypothetical protein
VRKRNSPHGVRVTCVPKDALVLARCAQRRCLFQWGFNRLSVGLGGPQRCRTTDRSKNIFRVAVSRTQGGVRAVHRSKPCRENRPRSS